MRIDASVGDVISPVDRETVMHGAIAPKVTFRCVVAAALLASSPVLGQQAQSSGCTAPKVPPSFVSTDKYNVFVDKTLTYRSCIDAFVSKQRELAKKHTDLGSAAAKEWNEFAALMANVKPPAE